jgi:alkanesulfonate monooxygenase SsuD/methylene tetrahydromethanopterin reductase-like flavin-dependent oxidoreductase (luciferase family)
VTPQLHLGGFQIASQVTHSHAAWRDVGKWYAQGVLPRFVRTAEQFADQIEKSFNAREADGFMVSAAQTPGTFNDFVDSVVPELQRRVLFRTEYSGNTLRDHLRLGPAEFTAPQLSVAS